MKHQMPEEELPIVIPPEDLEIAPPKPENPLVGALKRPGVYLSGALRSLKGRDMDTLIEEFTTDMTLVMEGLSDDQERLGARNEVLAQQCERALAAAEALTQRVAEQGRAQEAQERKITALEKRTHELDRKLAERSPKDGLIRRLTWLAGLCIVAMLLLTVIKLLFD